MAQENFEHVLAEEWVHEGGYSDHPRDPGGATNMGITHLILAKHRGLRSVSKAEVKALTRREAAEIYREEYWDVVWGDKLPHGSDLSVMDYAVNSGPSRSIKKAQGVVGAPVDGKMGPVTLMAIVEMDGDKFVRAHCNARMRFLGGLPTWETFKRGWTRRVAAIEAEGVRMWLAAGGAASMGEQRQQLRQHGQQAGTKAKQQEQAAAGTGAAGTAAGAGDTVVNAGPNWMLIAVVAVVVIVVAAVLVVRARQDRERSSAYQAAAIHPTR